MTKFTKICLAIILVISFVVRQYKIDNPVADWHSWRQADTAAVIRNFYKLGYNPFVPIYDDMSGVAENPVPNPHRYRFVEFPIYGSLVYFGYLINHGVDERIAREVAVLFSLGSLIYIYLITRKYFGNATGLIASLLYGILPFNIYFSRVILPEPSLVFFSLGMFYWTDDWIEKPTRKNLVLALFFTICALLTKPYAIFYMMPLLYKYLEKNSLWPIPKRFLIFAVISLIPIVAWRIWISQHPEGIPASNWLFNGDGIRFKLVFWKWILQDRLGGEILSAPGFVLLLIGLLKKPKIGQSWQLHWLAFAMLLFLITIATGNVRHNYYQTFIIPALAIFMARGFVLLIEGIPGFTPRIFTIPLALLFAISSIYITWNQDKGFFQINNPAIVEAGKEADKILPKDALVVAPYQGDTSFLYQTNRAGWAFVAFPLRTLIQKYGISYYISTALDAKTKWAMREFTVIDQKPNFVIIDLTKPNPEYASPSAQLSDPEPM